MIQPRTSKTITGELKMPEDATVKDLRLDDIVIGLGQVRTSTTSKDIDELATSINKVGVLQPILVCPAEKEGKWEAIIGQRRVLACRELGLETIPARLLAYRPDETERKALSLTENMLRLDLSHREKVDALTYLYKKYDSVGAVAEATGISESVVRDYVNYIRLKPEMKELVDSGDVKIGVAVKAQDAAAAAGEYQAEEAIQFAKEMSGMSGAQVQRIVKKRQENPTAPADELIEAAKGPEKITQIIVTLLPEIHSSLQAYARDEKTNQDDAAAILISEGLASRGYVEE
jgi:ParB family chromosome partitioning protein